MSEDKYSEAKLRMERRFKDSDKQDDALLEQISKMVIVDRLVPPRMMEFYSGFDEEGIKLRYPLNPPGGGAADIVKIHRHALNQLCAKVHLPMTYVNQLNQYVEKPGLESKTTEDWKRQLLCYNLNELFHEPEWPDRSGTPRFLHRIVDGELRGFLSRRYNRHLASAPLLRSFVEECRAQNARPLEGAASAVRVSMKFLMPKVFEAFPGEYVCLGSEWGNSDFGAGMTTVSQTIWRIATGTSSVLDETFGRVHLGSIIEDSDIEMSSETAAKEVAALQSAIRDTVKAHFQESSVDRLLTALRAAHDEQIPWTRLRGQLSRFLNKGDILWLQSALDTGESIIDLPPVSMSGGERVPNLYWASNAVSALAAKTDDLDRRRELQLEAGKLLNAVLEK